jgi:hypothetical protein
MFLALWEYEVKSGCEESVKKDSRAPMARVLTGLGSSEAIRTTARLVSWVIPLVLRFTSLSISGIPVKPYELFTTTHKGEYEMPDAAGEELTEQGAPHRLV